MSTQNHQTYEEWVVTRLRSTGAVIEVHAKSYGLTMRANVDEANRVLHVSLRTQYPGVLVPFVEITQGHAGALVVSVSSHVHPLFGCAAMTLNPGLVANFVVEAWRCFVAPPGPGRSARAPRRQHSFRRSKRLACPCLPIRPRALLERAAHADHRVIRPCWTCPGRAF